MKTVKEFMMEQKKNTLNNDSHIKSENQTIKNLIRAVSEYALENNWTDRDMVNALIEMGVKKEDFEANGYGEFIRNLDAF